MGRRYHTIDPDFGFDRLKDRGSEKNLSAYFSSAKHHLH